MLRFEDLKESLNNFKQSLLEKFKDNLISLVLFGSVARGTARDESDLDLLIILKDAPVSYYKRLEPVIDIELKLREGTSETAALPMLSTIILSWEEAKENRNIFLDMIDASIILYDKNDFFKNRLKELKKRLLQLGSKKIVLEDKTWYWNLKPDSAPGEVIEALTTNKEQGERLLKEAQWIFEKDLSLKGCLRILGIDYPKVHDAGLVFVKEAGKNLNIDKSTLTEIERISKWLSEARAPSFYGERDFTLEDAKKAFEDAAFVLEEIKAALIN